MQAARERRLEQMRRIRELERQQRERAKRERLEALWQQHQYVTNNVPLCETLAQGDEADDDADGSSDRRLDAALAGDADERQAAALRFVIGDVTHPQMPGGADGVAIVAHCVDTSGHWGHGGLFSAIDHSWPGVGHLYELAGAMKDLHLGDAHLLQPDPDGTVYVALMVVYGRARSGQRQPLDTEALAVALRRVCCAAKRHGASVHVPRIGYRQPHIAYYAIERMLSKELVQRGIDVSVYYFRRSQGGVQIDGAARAASARTGPNCASVDDAAAASAAAAASPSPPEHQATSAGGERAQRDLGAVHVLPDVFVQCCFLIAPDVLDAARLRRFIVAYGGRIASDGTDAKEVTHVVLADGSSSDQWPRTAVEACSAGAVAVTPGWVWSRIQAAQTAH